jgi:hypothetical protein
MTNKCVQMIAATAAMAVGLLAADKPKSVIHVVTIQWKPGTTEDQIKSAIGGVEAAAKLFPGIKNIWLRSFKVQGMPIGECPGAQPVTHAIVMEFESEKSLADYHNSKAQAEFYKVYMPHRGESRTHDITN